MSLGWAMHPILDEGYVVNVIYVNIGVIAHNTMSV